MNKLKYKFKYKYIKSRDSEKKNLFQRLLKSIIINNSEHLRRKTSHDYNDFKILTSIFNKKFEDKIKLLISECSDTLNIYNWNINIEFHRFSDDGNYGINIMAESNKDKYFFHVAVVFDNINAYNPSKDIFTKTINIKEIEHILDKANIDNMFLYGSTGHSIYSTAFDAKSFNEHEIQLKKFLKIMDNQKIINKCLEKDFFSTKFLINKDIKWALQFSNSGLFNTGPNYIYTPFYSIDNISKKDFLISLIEAKYIKVGEDYLDMIENNSFEDILEYIRVINY